METFIACVRTMLLGGLTFFVRHSPERSSPRSYRRFSAILITAVLGLAPSANALQLNIAWDIVASGELGFNVERSVDGSNFSQIATVAAGVSSYTDANVSAGTYWYRVRAFNATSYSAYSNVASTQASVSAPSFTVQPVSQSAPSGGSVSFSVTAIGSPTPSLQWKKNGLPIAGATTETLTLSSLTSNDVATYTVAALNSAGSVTSIGAVLTLTTTTPVAPPPSEVQPSSKLANFSARALPGKGNQSMNMEFVVKGSDTSVLLRAIGPGLAPFTTASTFADPKITLLSGGSTIGTNDNWGGSASLASVFTQAGAFPLASNSKDAAMVQSLAPNTYTASLSGKSGGIAMIEAYDAGLESGRISQLSVSSPIGTGDQRLIGGFTITGTTALRVLIRAVGPSLGGRGVLSDPQLELHRGATLIQRNDNWGGTSALISTFNLAGASAWSSTSKDAAMEATLEPGTYTTTVSGVNNTTGYGQLEVYEVR